MSEQRKDQLVVLNYSNWLLWEHYIKSSTRRKNAKFALDRPEPIDPRTPQIVPATATTPAITVTPQPTAEELKAYREELEKWEVANNIAAGVILISHHLVRALYSVYLSAVCPCLFVLPSLPPVMT